MGFALPHRQYCSVNLCEITSSAPVFVRVAPDFARVTPDFARVASDFIRECDKSSSQDPNFQEFLPFVMDFCLWKASRLVQIFNFVARRQMFTSNITFIARKWMCAIVPRYCNTMRFYVSGHFLDFRNDLCDTLQFILGGFFMSSGGFWKDKIPVQERVAPVKVRVYRHDSGEIPSKTYLEFM